MSKTCFVIMPFSDYGGIVEQEWTTIYDCLLKPSIEDCNLGYECKRSEIRNGAFTKDIILGLKHSKVVLADITYFNPNVMWELGIRHSLSMRTILVNNHKATQKWIISDIPNYGVVSYNIENLVEINKFKATIKRILTEIEANPERNDSPVFDYLQDNAMSTILKNKNFDKLRGVIAEITHNLYFIDGILNGTVNIGPDDVSLNRFRTQALDLLLSTNYIIIDDAYLKLAFQIVKDLGILNKRLDCLILDKRLGKDHRHPQRIKEHSIEVRKCLLEAQSRTENLLKPTENN